MNGCPLPSRGDFIEENIFVAASPIVTNPTPAVCEDSQGAGQASGLDLTAFESGINSDPGIVITWYNDYDGTNVSDEITAPANTSVTATNGQQFYALVDNGSCQTVATVTYTINPFPSDPTNLQFTDVGCNGFTANWAASSDAAEYDIEVVEVLTGTVADTRTVATADPAIFNSLDTYQEYTFTVLARNACGESSVVTSASFTTDGIPLVPTGLVANDIVCDGFRATWDAVANATDYTVEVYRDAALTQLETSQPVVAPATATVSASFSGLTLGATYYFHVRAENDCGDSNYSSAISVTLNNVPPDPTSVAIQNTSCTALDATWDVVPNATGYVVEFIDVDAGSTFAAPDRTETITDPLITSFNFTGLTAGTQYQFRVRATNVCGDGNNVASPVESTDETPTVPTGLTALNPTCTSFEVNWIAATDADFYTLEVYDDAGLDPANRVDLQSNITALTATVINLDNSTTYFFRVRAENTCGVSSFTATETMATDNIPADPTNPVANAVTCTSFQASWTAAADAENYVVEVIDVTAGADYSAPTFTATVAAPTTGAAFSGLAESNSYEFRVRATNVCGESGNTSPVAFSTGTPPAADDQLGLTVCETVAGSAQASGVNLRASDAAIDGGAGHPITWYRDYDGTTLSNPVANPLNATVNDGQVFYAEVNDGTCSSVATVSYVVNSQPTPFNLTPNPLALCPGDAATVNLDGSQTGVNYEIYLDNAPLPSPVTVTGTGSPIDLTLASGDFVNGQVITVRADNSNCPAFMIGSATIDISTIQPFGITSPASVTACESGNVTISLGDSESGVTYELLKDGAATGTFINGTDAAIDFTFVATSGDDGRAFSVVGRRGVCEQLMTGSTTVSVTTLTVDAGSSQTITENTSTTLSGSAADGSGDYTYAWTSTPANQIAPGEESSPNPTTINLTTSTDFRLTVTDNISGCVATDVVTVTVTGGILSVTASATPATICAGEAVQLNASGSGGDGSYTYVWDNGIGAGQSPTVNPITTTTYEVEVTDGNGLTATNQVTVTANPLPNVHNVTPTPDVLVCSGADVTISLDGEEAGVTYTLYKNSAPITTGVTTSSTGSGLDFTLASSNFTNNDTLTVWAENSTTNCAVPMNGQAIIRLNTPQPFDVIAVNTDVCTGEDAVIRLTGFESGIDYEVFTGTNPTSIATFTGSMVASGMNIPAASLVNGESLTVRASNGSCTVLMNGAAPVNISTITVADAGTDETICADAYALNSPNALVSGETGTWTLVSGNGTFDNLNDPNTTVNGLGVGDNTFRWTVSNGGTCPSTQSEVTITRREITVAVAGAAQTVCTDATTLAANDPATGETGVWTVVNGTGTFDNANDPNTTVSGLAVGPNEFAWEISDGVCAPTVANVIVTRNSLTAVATATNTTVPNGDPAELQATPPADGVGPFSYFWESIPAGVVSNPNLQNFTSEPLTEATRFILTVTDNGVGASCQARDTVIVFTSGGILSVEAEANGFRDPISVCAGEEIILDALASNGDANYVSYVWTSDNGTIINDANTITSDARATIDPATSITQEVFRVTVTDGTAATATDSIVVNVNPLPTEFTIDNPIVVCANTDAQLELSGSEANVTYTLLRGNVPTTLSAVGTGDPGPFFITIPQTEVANGTTWTVQAQTTAGCTRMMPGFGEIQISDPAEYAITTDPVLTVCQGQAATITLGNSDNGVAYMLMNGGTPVDTLTGSTGNPLDFVLSANTFADGEVYTIVADNGSCQVNMSGSVTIDLVGLDATFAYDGNTFCVDGDNPLPVPGYTTGGTFTASSSDLKFVDDQTGEIDLAASVPNKSYQVFYELTSGSCTNTQFYDITIANTTPDPTFTYVDSTFCVKAGGSVSPSAGANLGTFSYTGAGMLDLATDGTINLETSVPGTYRVSNFIAGSGGSCAGATHEETIQILAADSANVSYNGGNPICRSQTTDPVPAFAPGTTTTGTFSVVSANAGDITIVPGTGLIQLSDTEAGVYDIKFVTNGPCPDSMIVSVTIEAATDASFTYPATSFCKGTGSVLPGSVATGPGLFSASASGLNFINATTGEIDVNGSDAGNYYVIYETTVSGTCNGRDSVAITINEVTADAGADDLACRFQYDLTGNVPVSGASGEWRLIPSGSQTATFANRFDPTTSVSVSDSGRYEFEWRVTQGGCSITDTVAIQFYYSLQVVQSGYSPPLDCVAADTAGGFASMAAWGGSGSFTFSWSAGAGTPTSSITLADKTAYPPEGGVLQGVNSVPVGTHTLTITDNVSGCDTVVFFAMGVVSIDDDFTSSGDSICTGDSNGEITLNANTDNNRTYSVTYSDENGNPVGSPTVLDTNVGTTATAGGFAVGVYTLEIEVTASDDPAEINCRSYQTVEIAERPAPEISVNTIVQPSCPGTTDGGITINVSGPAVTAFNWSSSNGDTYTTQNLNNVSAGEYTLEVTHNGTCIQTFGPYDVLPQNTSDGPLALTPLAPTVQCNSFAARWSDEGTGISYQLDVSEDASFTTPLVLDSEAIAANTTTFTVSGLAPGTPYFYRVRSVATSGCVSENSNVISATTETGAVPTIQAATFASCDQFVANWSDVTGASDYAVQVATDAAFTNVLTGYDSVAVGSSDNKLLITGLTGGQTYYYRVTVTTACGSSAYSTAASVTTEGLNDAPANLTATAGCTTAELSWQAVSGSVSKYEVFVDDDNDFTNGTLSGAPDATEVTATTTVVGGLTDGETYFFHVLATLNGCNTTMAVSDAFTTRGVPTAPVVSDSDIACNGFTLSWPAVPDADDYVVHVSRDGFATFVGDTITSLSLVLDTLTQGTNYQYQVKARGCVESAFTNGSVTTEDISGTLASPPTAALPTCNGFDVSWSAVTNAVSYTVQASADGFVTFEELIVRTTDTTFNALVIGTTYEYRVAVNYACGSSGFVNGTGTITTSPEAECGCGFDKATFVVDPVNENCLGSKDGALLVNLLPNVSTTPTRFRFRYYSLDNPADSSAGWETGANGTGLVWAASDRPSGDYLVKIQDTNAPSDCDTVKIFNVTIGAQNGITVAARAETCEAPGGIVVTLPSPSACPASQSYGVILVDSDVISDDEGNTRTFNGLTSGDYRVAIRDFLNGGSLDTISVFVPNNCSSGGEPTTACNLNGITFLPETTLAACETGQGSVTFTEINSSPETFTFTVIEEGGVVFETKEGSSGITFDNLPSRRYTYEIYDDLGQLCRGKFTVGTKSVGFSATLPQDIACDDVLTQINVAVDTATTLAAGPYKVFLIDQTDTLARTSLPLGSLTTTFADVAVGGSYEVVIVAAAEDACVARRTVDATPPGTTALQFTYALDSTACFQTRGGGSVTVRDIVVADNQPFEAYLYRVDSGNEEEYASRKFGTTPQNFAFEDIANGQYQVHLVQMQSGCVNTVQEKRSATFTIDGPEQGLVASIRSYVEVTVNYPYGTIEVDSIVGGGAPYEVRIAADPSGASTDWVEVINENPIVRPYRYTYLDQPVGTYFVEVRDRFGCVITQMVEVGYTSELYIPNIFTPNGDGENDTFYILNLEDYGENAGVQLTITNRWGRQIYRSKNYTNVEAWDGGDYSDGVYFYHLTLPDNTTHSGWIEIWRGRTP